MPEQATAFLANCAFMSLHEQWHTVCEPFAGTLWSLRHISWLNSWASTSDKFAQGVDEDALEKAVRLLSKIIVQHIFKLCSRPQKNYKRVRPRASNLHMFAIIACLSVLQTLAYSSCLFLIAAEATCMWRTALVVSQNFSFCCDTGGLSWDITGPAFPFHLLPSCCLSQLPRSS
jgi:hypothetical protein